MENLNDQTNIRLMESLLKIYNVNSIKYLKRFIEGETGLMFLLYNEKEALEPTDIAYRLGITKGRVTSILSSLSDKNYIEITLFSEDRRRFKITLTDHGKKHMDEQIQTTSKYFSLLIERIGKEKANELSSILFDIYEKMKDVEIWDTM